jgi:predicted flap endonuclease-1-like 5' DNA nuclease
MDATAIVALAAGGAGLLGVLLLAMLDRRQGRRLRTALATSRAEAVAATNTATAVGQQLTVARAGEREAAWVAQTATRASTSLADQVTSLEDRLHAADVRAAAIEGTVAGLRGDLIRADESVHEHRAAAEAAAERAAGLESELLAARREISQLHDDLEAARLTAMAPRPSPAAAPEADELRGRLHGALSEVDRLRDRVEALETTLALTRAPDPAVVLPALLPPDPWTQPGGADPESDAAHLRQALDEARRVAVASRLEIDRLASEVARVREEADQRIAAAVAGITQMPVAPPHDEGSGPRLLAREAEIRDLEERLAALTATRNSESKRLNERIASLERLYLDIEARDFRITELEMDLKEATETLEVIRNDAARLQTRLGAAQAEVAAARRVETTSADLATQLAEARRRVSDLETAAIRSRSNDDDIGQLRSLLAAERDRNLRLERRAVTEGRSEEMSRAVAAATFPLQETITRLERELAQPVAPVEPSLRDDVLLIRGIGPRIAAILAANGITSLRQIAAFTAADIAEIGPLLPVYPQRITDDHWVDQARELITHIW